MALAKPRTHREIMIDSLVEAAEKPRSPPVSRSYRVEREGAYWMLYGVDVATHPDGRVTVTERRLEGAPNMRAIIERRLIDFALDERLDPRLK